MDRIIEPDGDESVFIYISNNLVQDSPDGLGRATGASDAQRVYASSAAYHPSGGLSALSYGNGLAFSASYNARQLMTAMQVSGGGTTAISFVYGRDPNGRITSISDLAVSGQYRTFGYDGLGRLTTATGPWGSGSYTYDALNNITTRTLGSRVVEMQYDASNRLHRHRDTADGNVWRNYAYDSRGNVTNNGSISFTYDRAERPVSISGGASGSFVYDAHGRRVKQVTGGQTIYSVYSSGGTLLYRDNATTSTATDYIRLGTRAIARVRGSHVEWTHADHLGSPAAATSLTGAVLWREDHTPFGEARQGPTQNVDNEGFTGHIADAATGLVYMQARYYDPVVGRFLSSDPVGFVEGGTAYFNRYAYTFNDPVNLIDPDGEAAQSWEGENSNPYAFTLRRAENGYGAGRGRGSPFNHMSRADSQRYGDQFTGTTERFVEATVNAATGARLVGILSRTGGAAQTAGRINENVAAIRSLERGARNLDRRAQEHETRAAAFRENPTVRPGMETQPPEVIEAQQEARAQHLEREAAEFRRQAADRRAEAERLRDP